MLCETERFIWKARDLFISQLTDVDSYFHLRSEKIRHARQEWKESVSESAHDGRSLASLPSPTLMKDLFTAAQRVVEAMTTGEKITIFADYDVDGTASAAMLKKFFEHIGYPVDVYIPDRLLEGYGLNVHGLGRLAAAGTRLVITVDNGISAVAACQEARTLGIDVIITDHHDLPPTLPEAYAILNPKQHDCQFPYFMLAGVGVAFYLMIAMRILLREKGNFPEINLKNYLDFVAIGTIADMAPLTGLNHTLCRVGLEVLNTHLKSGRRIGIYQLLRESGWDGFTDIDAASVGFKIAPRLNAAGRLGNALRSVEILCTEDVSFAKDTAHFLHSENTDRQALERTFTLEAMEDVTQQTVLPEALVLHREHWHPGVVGLVASRVLEKFYRPVLVFGTLNGMLKGSGRSTHGFNLFEVLNEVRSEFISFGGHKAAVGLTLAPEKLEWLQKYLNEKAAELIPLKDKGRPLYIDGILSLSTCLDAHFLTRLENFEPYGIENPRTRWLVGPAEIKHVKRMGKNPSDDHARVLIRENGKEFWLVAFGMASAFEELLATGTDTLLIVETKHGLWNGKQVAEARVIDYVAYRVFPSAHFGHARAVAE